MIIMLNLLIAFINDSYENLVSSKDAAFISERVTIISYIEKKMSAAFKSYLDSLYSD